MLHLLENWNEGKWIKLKTKSSAPGQAIKAYGKCQLSLVLMDLTRKNKGKCK